MPSVAQSKTGLNGASGFRASGTPNDGKLEPSVDAAGFEMFVIVPGLGENEMCT